jgi:Tfp pilus tip-associated adhesin PilY1
MSTRSLSVSAAALLLLSGALRADDKDLLKTSGAPPNLMIIFGNSQTLQQPILGSTSAWDGDADSPGSKMGAAKRVIKQFVNDRTTAANIGLSTFAHNPNAGSIQISGKHWLYAPLVTDFPLEPWREPAGTINRWGKNGEGPCTSRTVPSCTDRSPAYITLANTSATVVGPFFGPLGAGTAYIYLDGSASSATKRIQLTLSAGKYGDAFTDGTLSTYTRLTHSMVVIKRYQEKVLGAWTTRLLTPNGNFGTAIVPYVPPSTLPPDLFYSSGADAGKEIGFLNDPRGDLNVNANCSGWEYQRGSTPVPVIKIPRDYSSGPACAPSQNSYACVARLLRPQARLVHYDAATDAYTTTDPDNPGYTGSGSRYADGCDSALLGGVDNALDIVENQAVFTTRNGSQAPIKALLQDIFNYLTDPTIDGFQAGKRLDDPDASCRKTAVILIYDNFNGCQNDGCNYLTNYVLTKFKQIEVPVFVIGFGSSATGTSGTGTCIAQNTGAILDDGTPGYIPVTTPEGLYQALDAILSLIQSSKEFGSSSVSSAQAAGDQMAYLATFNATRDRSIWNGRVNGYKLDPSGHIQLGQRTIQDPLDPFNGVTLPSPSNDPSSLIWNAGQNLAQTPGTGATDPAAVLSPGASTSTGSYVDDSTDTVQTIPTRYYPGRKIVFSLPVGYLLPVLSLPIGNTDTVPETRQNMTFTPTATWWPALKALLGPQFSPPAALNPPLTDTEAANILRFIWGDRDAVITTTKESQRYRGLKLGDIFHSSPLLVGRPGNFAYYMTNLHDYQKFFATYRTRRRVLYFGANDGLLHAIDAAAWDRDRSVCEKAPDGSDGHCYDLGSGAELFAYAPRDLMQTYKTFKDSLTQPKRAEWSVDGPPTSADVFLDASHSGTPNPSHRAWHTVLVGGMREGNNFEGTSGVPPFDSQGSYFALDITQPDELTVDANGNVVPPSSSATFAAPQCLNANGDASCGKDASDPAVRAGQPARAWPTVLWEIQDKSDLDVAPSPGAGYVDMGETWTKPAVGRVRVCRANCGNIAAPLPVYEDHYVAIFGGGFDRSRLNQRGNWLYMVDIETGKTLYRVNSSCGINAGSGSCTPVYFGSVPSEPTAVDFQEDGYLDRLYVGDLKGQLWRIDLTDLRLLASPPGGRLNNQLDLDAGSGKPFLLFRAPQPAPPATDPFYPIYFRPIPVSLGYDVGGTPAVGVAFGTGDRDDILARIDIASKNTKARYYYVVDTGNTVTRTESDLAHIASSTAAPATSISATGWYLELAAGERVITDSLAVNGVIYFGTFNPVGPAASNRPCSNPDRCGIPSGISRFYRVLFSSGDAYLGSDRGETQPHAMFLSEPVFFLSYDQHGQIVFSTENSIKSENARGGGTSTLRNWKETSRRP